jgi:hypothetical protein
MYSRSHSPPSPVCDRNIFASFCYHCIHTHHLLQALCVIETSLLHFAATVSTLTISSEPSDWEGATAVAIQEVRRLQRHGINQGARLPGCVRVCVRVCASECVCACVCLCVWCAVQNKRIPQLLVYKGLACVLKHGSTIHTHSSYCVTSHTSLPPLGVCAVLLLDAQACDG